MSQTLINCLYSHFKNHPNDSQRSKKLKIVCDWDEVIQPHEPYALWLTPLSEKQKKDGYVDEQIDFSEYFEVFWEKHSEPWIEYSSYGSRLIPNDEDTEKLSQQQTVKNSPEFYQQAPFLTIAKELLKLIREDKIEKLIFLSAYDKRKFPQGDPRKKQIFKETFGRFGGCELELIGFENEQQGASKADWVKKNASDFDVVIDDNPNICKKITEDIPQIIVCAPYYPSVKDKHAEKVLLVKTSIADLQKENYKN